MLSQNRLQLYLALQGHYKILESCLWVYTYPQVLIQISNHTHIVAAHTVLRDI
jgi:hypothetical protein